MKKFIIDKIDGYNYYLHDEDEKTYVLNIEFYDINTNIKEGDYFYINDDKLVNSRVLSFGPIPGIFGKNITSSDDKDLLVLVSNNKKLYLKRYYG